MQLPIFLDPEIFRLIMSWYYSDLDKFCPDHANYGEGIKNIASINESGSLSEKINNVMLAQLRERLREYILPDITGEYVMKLPSSALPLYN